MRSTIATLLFVVIACQITVAQFLETKEEKDQRMEWFRNAKLGIFIHWGIYAVNGIDESWSFYNG
jgi:alpha-L-fucosidase